MLTKTKMALVAALLIGSAPVAVAQYDGDANLVAGAHQQGVVIRQAPAAFENVFAATTQAVRASRQELDSDGNPIPGSR
jgi:hypothetical protein